MSFLNKILGRNAAQPVQRIRVCVECGMPIDQHKDWCAIHRTRQEMESKQSPTPEGA